MVAAVLFIALVVTLVLNMPVGIAIGVSSLCAILADGRISSLYIVQQLVTSADSFPLMAIPLFILAGELMGAGGVSKRLLNVCNVFLGKIHRWTCDSNYCVMYVLRSSFRIWSGNRCSNWFHGNSDHAG